MIVLLEYINQWYGIIILNGPARSGGALATPAPPSKPPLIL